MRKIFLYLIILCTSFLHAQNQSADNILEISKKLGLVSNMTTVKALAESKMISLMSNSAYKLPANKAKIETFHTDYNLLKLKIDQLINQIEADMIVSNNLKTYKRLNKFYKEGKSLPNSMNFYTPVLNEIEGRLSTFLLRSYSSAQGFGITEILAVIELGHTIITDVRDFREKKIANIIKLIDPLKLKSIKELSAPKEKD